MQHRSRALVMAAIGVCVVAASLAAAWALGNALGEPHGADASMPATRISDPPRDALGKVVLPAGAATQRPIRVTVLDQQGPRPDGTFTFTARLTNPTDGDIELDPCPSFRMGVSLDDDGDSAYYRLDCARFPRVPANGHIDLPMVAHTTFGSVDLSDLAVGFSFIWQLWGPGFNGGPYGTTNCCSFG